MYQVNTNICNTIQHKSSRFAVYSGPQCITVNRSQPQRIAVSHSTVNWPRRDLISNLSVERFSSFFNVILVTQVIDGWSFSFVYLSSLRFLIIYINLLVCLIQTGNPLTCISNKAHNKLSSQMLILNYTPSENKIWPLLNLDSVIGKVENNVFFDIEFSSHFTFIFFMGLKCLFKCLMSHHSNF